MELVVQLLLGISVFLFATPCIFKVVHLVRGFIRKLQAAQMWEDDEEGGMMMED